jgi:hypothetical protein
MHSKQRALDAFAKHLGLYGGGRAPAQTPADIAREHRDARAALRARLMRIMRGEEDAAAEEKEEEKEE